MDTKSGVCSFQLYEIWFTMDDDLIRSALGITPKDSAHPFMAHPTSDMSISVVENYSIYDQPMLNMQDFKHNIYKRPQSPFHITIDDYSLGMAIPKDLISDVIHEAGGKKKKAPPAGKSKKPTLVKQLAPAQQTKPVKEKTSKPSPSKKIRKAKVMKVHKGKRRIQMSLESFQAPIGGVAIHEPDLGITQKLLVVEGKGKGIASDELAAQSLLDLQKLKKKSTTDQYIFQRQTPVTQDASTRSFAQPRDDTSVNVVHDTPSPADAETGVDAKKYTMALKDRIVELDEGHAGSNPENPPISSRTLSSMKNLDDAFTFGDQFLNDKPTEDEPGKPNVETKVESMVIVHIYQASLSTPLLSTLTPTKPVSPPAQEPIVTTTIATTTTKLPPLPPPQQKSTTDPELANYVSTLEKICANINKYVNDVIKEAVHNALQAPIYERFRDLSEFEMKEILRDQMFESGSYRSHPEHTTLYKALEASIDRKNREEFNQEMAKSHKRRCDDQDPSSPSLKDSDQSKKKRYDSDASASK
nr:hypothetical protein [Tanacetum cinerariifolium]